MFFIFSVFLLFYSLLFISTEDIIDERDDN